MPPAPQSLADLLAEESGDDLDKMEVDRPSAVAPPKKAASLPATPPRPPPLEMPDGNEAVNAAIAGASSGIPKRKKVEHDRRAPGRRQGCKSGREIDRSTRPSS